MSIENLAMAKKLYLENNSQTALASRTRYDFAANINTFSGRRLDVGTNMGHGLTEDNKPDFILDINRHYLEYQTGIRVQADGSALPFSSRSMNMTTLFEVVEHVPYKTAIGMLKEANRVTKPEGLVIISTPNKGAYGNRLSSPDHIKEYSEDELLSMISDSGLTVKEKYGQGFLKEDSIKTKIIRFARDNRVVSWFYYHGPLVLRNRLRIGLQKAVRSEEIRVPEGDETIKNFVLVLQPNSCTDL